jgi:ribokinase
MTRVDGSGDNAQKADHLSTTTPPAPWPDEAGRGIAVLGSINRDLLLRVPQLPRDGETLHALGSAVALGGKGANQAVAARLAGVPAAFFGAVGDDADGQELLAALRAADVGVRDVAARRGQRTGAAVVIVDQAGDNVIVLAAGANGSVDQGYLDRAWPLIRAAASVLLVQGEIPAEVNRAAIGLAARDGIRVVVNLAPYQELGPVTGHADPLVVNEVEAGQLLGTAIPSLTAALDAAHALARRARSVVITLGAQGAVAAVAGGRAEHVPAPFVAEVVDTTGAGDAFVGVLSAALLRGHGLFEAAAIGVQAASSAVRQHGAAASYPDFSRLFPAKEAS